MLFDDLPKRDGKLVYLNLIYCKINNFKSQKSFNQKYLKIFIFKSFINTQFCLA